VKAERIAEILAPFMRGASLPAAALDQFSTYLELLLRWNSRVNLTAAREPEYIVSRHFGESLFLGTRLFPAFAMAPDARLLDLGSGAGFPGLPIKVAVPGLPTVLVESNARKAAFLREVIRALPVSGAEVFADRAERLVEPRPAIAPSDDFWKVVTLRAVERFELSARLASRLVAPGGTLALLVGEEQALRTPSLLEHFHWSDPERIPLSMRRVILLGTNQRTQEPRQ
jgi:16S rRNA (guanine527-N7)-methyltransferase